MPPEAEIKCGLEHPHCPKPAEDHHDDHAHDHAGAHLHRPAEKRRLMIVLVMTAVMMVVEFVAGIVSGSLALVGDAGHMLTHSFALFVSFGAICIAGMKTCKERSFGLYRIEVVAALVNGLGLIVMTGFIFYEAIERMLAPQVVNTTEMLIVAVIGLVVNLVSAAILSGVHKDDLNVRSAFFHLLGDTLSSVAIVIGGVVIVFTKWYVIDPVLGLLIACVIAVWSVKLIRDSLHILLEATPRHISIESVVSTICGTCPAVRQVHDVHIWEITSRMYAMTAHLVVEEMSVSAAQTIAGDVCRVLGEKHDIEHATLQMEALGNTDTKPAEQTVSTPDSETPGKTS